MNEELCSQILHSVHRVYYMGTFVVEHGLQAELSH